MHKVIHLYAAIAILGTLLLWTAFQSRPQSIAIPSPIEDVPDTLDLEQPNSANSEEQLEYGYAPKRLYPLQEHHITRTLVVASITEESTDWVAEELWDIMEPHGPLSTAIYVSDDREAPLHPPQNSGHEANVYLTYVIDHYDELPDVVIFMHAHRVGWHNNDLLDLDSALMVRNLSPLEVMSRGYANLRCHWDPGCPEWIHPSDLSTDDFKQEQSIIANAWTEIFPGLSVPGTLAQPCCSQFAVSRDRIRTVGRARYVYLRDWIYSSALGDYLIGRVFEYLWQYILSDSAIACPVPQDCYCRLYGACFDSDADYEAWVDIYSNITQIQNDLDDWNEKSEYHREHCLPNALKDHPDHDYSANVIHAALSERLGELEGVSDRLARVAFKNGRRSRGLP